jgi:FtsX-like permease family
MAGAREAGLNPKPASGQLAGPQPGAMRRRDRTGDRKPQAKPVTAAGAVGAAALERLKQPPGLLPWDHRTGVGHGKHRVTVPGCRRDLDGPVRHVVPHGIVDIAAFAVASLLTMAAVAWRVREFGTLKALGWRSRRITAQVMAEPVALGVIGGAAGVGLGFAGAAIITAIAPKLSAGIASATGQRIVPIGSEAAPSGPA